MFSLLVSAWLSGYSVGIFFKLSFSEGVALTLLFAVFLAFIYGYDQLRTLHHYLLAMLVFCFGVTCYQYLDGCHRLDILKMQTIEGQAVSCEGQIVKKRKSMSGQWKYLVCFSFHEVVQKDGLRIYSESDLPLGSMVDVHGKVSRLKERRNFLRFDDYAYGLHAHICGQIYKDDLAIFSLQSEHIPWLYRYRAALKQSFSSYPDRVKATILSMVFGHKEELPYQQKEIFFKLGLLHILAISGLHFGLLILMVYKILRLCHFSLLWQWAGLLVICGLYLALLGFPVSACRVYLMLIFYILSRLLRKKTTMLQLVLMSGVAQLVIEGVEQIENLSFLLSYIATITVIMAANMPIPKIKYHFLKALVRMGMISLIVNLTLMPLQFFYFHYLSMGQVISNILFIPVYSCLIVVFWAIVLIHFLLSVPEIVLLGVDWVLRFVQNMTAILSGFRMYDQYSFPVPVPLCALLISQLLVAVWYLYGYSVVKMKKALFMALSIAGLAVITCQLHLWEYDLEIYVPYVGQGSGAIVKNSDHITVFDTGPPRKGYNPLIDLIEKKCSGRIDLLVISHYDSDHYGNLTQMITELEIVEVWLNDYAEHPELVQLIEKKLVAKEIQVRRINKGVHVSLPNEAFVDILELPASSRFTSDNNRSLVALYHKGSFSALFPGDIDSKVEKALLDQYDLDVSILFAAHHGSNASSSTLWMKSIQPEIVVAQAGYRNRYRHPGKHMVKRVRQLKLPFYRIDQNGQVNFILRGKTLYCVPCISFNND